MTETLTVQLPMPPSLWKLYRGSGKNRSRSPEYKKWAGDAGWMLIAQRNRQGRHKRLDGDVTVSVRAYREANKRRDLDNILKALLDLLTSTQTIKDDSQVVAIDARWVDEGVPCELTVKPA